jgi:hypothetical protein
LFDIFDTIKVSVYSLTKTINKEAAHEGWKGVKHHLMAMLKVKGPETKINETETIYSEHCKLSGGKVVCMTQMINETTSFLNEAHHHQT